MLPLRTKRLVLRSFALNDAAAFAAYRSEPEVARYQSWYSPYPVEAARELMREMMDRGPIPKPGEWNQIAVELAVGNEAGDLVGDCAFRVLSSQPTTAQVGFTLARRYWGNGYATEATGALIRWLFDEAGMQRVVADCDAENRASQRVLERLGMKRTEARDVMFKGLAGREFTYEMSRVGCVSANSIDSPNP